MATSTRIANAPRPERDDDEIEITPEMITAGVFAFSEYDSRFEGPEENAIRIYLAMERARSK
jgi:hypothetical protein